MVQQRSYYGAVFPAGGHCEQLWFAMPEHTHISTHTKTRTQTHTRRAPYKGVTMRFHWEEVDHSHLQTWLTSASKCGSETDMTNIKQSEPHTFTPSCETSYKQCILQSCLHCAHILLLTMAKKARLTEVIDCFHYTIIRSISSSVNISSRLRLGSSLMSGPDHKPGLFCQW